MAGPDGILGHRSASRVEDVARDLSSGASRWALFIGAGLSASVGLPGWETFLRDTAMTFGVECPPEIHEDMFPRIAQKCLDASSPTEFYNLVGAHFCRDDLRPTELHRQLLDLPFELFVTTNFDCLIPFLHQSRIIDVPPPRELTYPNIPVVDMHGKRLVLLHGWCACTHPGGPHIDADIVLTEDSYSEGYKVPGAPLPPVLETIFREYRVLMVGFSLADFPIRIALSEIMDGERYQAARTSSPDPARRYAIIPSEWDSHGDDDALDLSSRFGAYDFEPIFYLNPPHGRHEDLAKVVAYLYQLTTAPPKVLI